MARGKAQQQMGRQRKTAPPPLSRKQDMYAPEWDDPNVQQARVIDRNTTQKKVERGNAGILKRGNQ